MNIEEIHRSALPDLSAGISLFASMQWASMYKDHLQAYGLFDAAHQMQGTFLLFHKQKLGAGYTITPPLAPHIGLNYVQASEKKAGQQSHSKDVHRSIAGFLKARKDILTEVALSTEENDSQPYTWDDFEVRPRHSYLLGLERSEDELLAAMTPERRKNIRKAEEEGLLVMRSEDADRCYKLLLKTIERQEINIDKSILKRLLEEPALAENRSLYLCQNDGKDLAASVVVWDDHRSYYLIGGYDPEGAHQGAGTLNLWQAIKDAKARGNKIFDFEGSQLPEVERYFRGFGGELHTFFQITHASRLGKIAKRIKGSAV